MSTRDTLYELYQSEYLAMDGVEEWTLRQGSEADVTGVQGKRLGPMKAERPPMDRFGQQASQFTVRLFDTTLNGRTPHQDDVLVDAEDAEYTILSAESQRWGTQWDCRVIQNLVEAP